MKRKDFMDKKIVVFMRHGSVFHCDSEYENMNYKEFMSYLLKTKNPSLKKKPVKKNSLTRSDKYQQLKSAKIDTSLKDVNAIFPSPSRRAAETANLLRDYFQKKSTIISKVKDRDLLAEVQFTQDIITEKEFKENDGWRGCRKLLLRRWFDGENVETFEDSFLRVKELDKKIRNSKFDKIALITHGIFLRIIYMYYHKQLKVDNSGKLIRDDETFNHLLAAPRWGYGGLFELELNGEVKIIEKKDSEKDDIKILDANAIKKKEKKIIKPAPLNDGRIRNPFRVILEAFN